MIDNLFKTRLELFIVQTRLNFWSIELVDETFGVFLQPENVITFMKNTYTHLVIKPINFGINEKSTTW